MMHTNLYNLTKYDNLIALPLKVTIQNKIQKFNDCCIKNEIKNNSILSIFNSHKNIESSSDEDDLDCKEIIYLNKYSPNGSKNNISEIQTTNRNQIKGESNNFSETNASNNLSAKKGNKKEISLNDIESNKSKELYIYFIVLNKPKNYFFWHLINQY